MTFGYDAMTCGFVVTLRDAIEKAMSGIIHEVKKFHCNALFMLLLTETLDDVVFNKWL